MRTVIARLKHVASDLLAEGDGRLFASGDPGERRGAYEQLSGEFAAAAEPVTSYLHERYVRTVSDYGFALERGGAAELDILASPSPIATGVASFAALLPSRSIAMTCTEDVVADVARLPDVEQVHDNFVYEISHPRLDILAEEPAGAPPAAWQGDLLGLELARSRATGHGIQVAVLDTGLDPTHPEFDGIAVASFMEWDERGAPVAGSRIRDTHIHGTQVGSLLCGRHLGIAPGIGLNVGLIAPHGRTTFAQMNQGLSWAASSGFDIVSMSVGKPGYRSEMEEFVRFADQAGILICAAIGNSGFNTHRSPGDYRSVFGIGATDMNDAVWSQSARATVAAPGGGYAKPDIYAPGADVWTATPGGRYLRGSGTSFATPIVAGIAALVKELNIGMSPAELRAHLIGNCDQIALPAPPGGVGTRISAAKAVAAAP